LKKIGIISVPDSKKSFKQRILNKVVIKNTFGNNPVYVVAELSYTKEKLLSFNKNKLRRIIKKAYAFLENNGADGILFSGKLNSLLQEKYPKDFYEKNKYRKIPSCRIFDCFFELNKAFKNKTKQSPVMLIKDTTLQAVTFKTLSMVCINAREIFIHTNMKSKVEEYSENLFSEYGVLLNINTPPPSPYFLIDVDMGKIRIGDCIVDGAEFVSGSGIYEADPWEEARILGEENNLKISHLLSGENKIKIS